MKKMIIVNGEYYEMVTNVGLADRTGNLIIPKEYDRIIPINSNLFAAMEDILGGELTFNRGKISLSGLKNTWNDDKFKEKYIVKNVDFYSLQGKLESEKKILAYCPCMHNDLLVILDECYKWNIMQVDFKTQKLSIFNEYNDIDQIKEIANECFLIKKNDKYEIFSYSLKSSVAIPNCAEVISYNNHGFVFRNHNNMCGFMGYSGELILDNKWDEIILRDDYIEVRRIATTKVGNVNLKGVYSYTGQQIVPSIYLSIEYKLILSKDIFIVENFEGKNNRWYEIYSRNRKISSKNFWNIAFRKDGRLLYCSEGKYGLMLYDPIMDTFLELIPGVNDEMRFNPSDSTLICVKKENKYAIYDYNGALLKNFRRLVIIPMSERHLYVL